MTTTPGATGRDVQIPTDDGPVAAYLACPPGQRPAPGVLILPARHGMEQGFKDLADRLAGEGYQGLAMTWQARADDPPESRILADIDAAVAFWRQQPGLDASRLGVIGFCRGGTLVWLSMAQQRHFRAGVAMYGLPYYNDGKHQSALDYVESIEGQSLILHGGKDPVVPLATLFRFVERLQECDKPYQLKIYSDAGHRFFLPTDPNHIPAVAADCWRESCEFLRAYL